MPRRLPGPSFKQMAETVLRASDRPLTVAEIAQKAEVQGLITGEGRTPSKTFHATISRDIKTNGSSAAFVAVGNGRFALNTRLH